MAPAPTVGVLALQGDFEEHIVALEDIGVPAAPVRTAEQLDRVGALIVPGGESTSMAKLMDAYDLREPLRGFARGGRPVWGTCAGMILLAERLVEGLPEPLGLMDMLVRRNGFGRQVDSFETNLDVAGLDGGPFHAVFIRAPAVVEAGPAVEVLARLDDGTVVAARQGNLLATAFHPELTTDRRLHALFVAMLAAEVAR
ncbi:MAG: pyridoxal 5'-phosphate synthase glutaminase subunit PdxT [Chloroflexi bacterium]|nr:pyridoxal 5'-phosphate synthase glutaminase subunit PdxT [Chloroflexota bacterium]